MAQFTNPCCVLIATRDRRETLADFSLPSVKRQTLAPAYVVLVNDGGPFTLVQEREFSAILHPIRVIILENQRACGAAGAWNTGLQKIHHLLPDCFVAILDDDDAWDPCHLAMNETTARQHSAQITISGLRLFIDEVEQPRDLISKIGDREFLVGNPGWQGSNTFVRMPLLKQVGGFRDGLRSLNDRDLAVRLLRVAGVRVAYTKAWTCSWHIRSNVDSLSTLRSPAKLSGLRWFWDIYGHEMTPAEAKAFFDRASGLFGISQADIIDAGPDVPPRCWPRGDLHGD